MNRDETRELLQLLAGQPAPFNHAPEDLRIFATEDEVLGYSQLNELLLLFGFDRITYAFFCYLADQATDSSCPCFSSSDHLREGIDRFRQMAMLLYGNIKYAFKALSQNESELHAATQSIEPRADQVFAGRHEPLIPIRQIAPEDAYLTGYIVGREIDERLKNPQDIEAVELQAKREQVLSDAEANHVAYLASDHLDVYVATSMRQRAEFSAVSRLAQEIFKHSEIAAMKLRWFDPTQAVCPNRVDKGLAEALMLRRAACTIYLVQETDTLGKDSELASTLAQGKPVVAFIPTISDEYLDAHIENLRAADPDERLATLLLGQLKVFEPCAAWQDHVVRGWCDAPDTADAAEIRERLKSKMTEHYDKRAATLRDSHPLGIQVNLATGVANGVLVVRTVADCAKLVRRILTSTLEFETEDHEAYVALRETISECIFRVVTKDEMLTNSFWNHYLDPVV